MYHPGILPLLGSVDLLSARIKLTASWILEEAGTWGEIFDTDLVDWGESEEESP
jgi:hypothetical protein